MNDAVKHIQFVGRVAASREPGLRLRNATGRKRRRMPASGVSRDCG